MTESQNKESTKASLKMQRNSHGSMLLEPQHSPKRGYRRRSVLIGGIGAVAALAGGGWWLLQPRADPIDTHQIFSLPFEQELGPDGNRPYLEYSWLPDSTHLAGATQQELFLIDVQQRQKIWEQAFSSFPQNTLVLQWSADNQRILVTGEKQRYAQELIPGGKQIIWPGPTQFQSLPPPSEGDTRGVKVAFSPDRSLQAIANPTASTSVGIFDIHENRFIGACGTSQSYTSYDQLEMAWAPDGTSLAVYMGSQHFSTGSTSDTRFSSLPTLQVYRISDGHLLWRSTIANPGDNAGNRSGHIKWSPDNATIAYTYTTSLTTYRTTLTVVDVKSGATRFQTDMASFDQRVPPALTGEAFAWSHDGSRLAFLALEKGQSVVQVWNVHSSQHLFTCQRVLGMPLNISWSPDGTFLAAGYTTEQAAEATTTLQFWETQHGKARFSYQAPGFPHQLLWSPDSHSLATLTSQPTPLHFCAMGCHGFSFHKFLRVFEIG